MDTGSAGNGDAIRQAARGLESVLIRRMLEAMERAQLQSGLFGSSSAGQTRQKQFQMMLSRVLAEQEPFGIAEAISRQLGGSRGPDRTTAKNVGEGLKIPDERPMSLAERTASARLWMDADSEER